MQSCTRFHFLVAFYRHVSESCPECFALLCLKRIEEACVALDRPGRSVTASSRKSGTGTTSSEHFDRDYHLKSDWYAYGPCAGPADSTKTHTYNGIDWAELKSDLEKKIFFTRYDTHRCVIIQ